MSYLFVDISISWQYMYMLRLHIYIYTYIIYDHNMHHQYTWFLYVSSVIWNQSIDWECPYCHKIYAWKDPKLDETSHDEQHWEQKHSGWMMIVVTEIQLFPCVTSFSCCYVWTNSSLCLRHPETLGLATNRPVFLASCKSGRSSATSSSRSVKNQHCPGQTE